MSVHEQIRQILVASTTASDEEIAWLTNFIERWIHEVATHLRAVRVQMEQSSTVYLARTVPDSLRQLERELQEWISRDGERRTLQWQALLQKMKEIVMDDGMYVVLPSL